MRNLSARILLGFALLSVAFGFITGTILRTMAVVEDQVHAIRLGYLPIAFSAKNFAQRQDDLRGYIDDDPTATSASYSLRPARERRNDSFKKLKNSVEKVTVNLDATTALSVERLAAQIEELNPSYDQLAAALRRGDAPTADSVAGPLRALRTGERRVWQLANDLSTNLEHLVDRLTTKLEDDEHQLRIVSIVMGLSALAVAVMIAIWVVITLRP